MYDGRLFHVTEQPEFGAGERLIKLAESEFSNQDSPAERGALVLSMYVSIDVGSPEVENVMQRGESRVAKRYKQPSGAYNGRPSAYAKSRGIRPEGGGSGLARYRDS